MRIGEISYKKRCCIIFLALFLIEVVIALFVRDQFIRPYLGDILIIGVVVYFIRILIGKRCFALPLYVTAFAIGIEILQYFQILNQLGLSHIRFLRIIFGTTFDLQDILCYIIGGCLLMMWQKLEVKRKW